MSPIGTNLPIQALRSSVASLIGRSGSSAFRLSTTPVLVLLFGIGTGALPSWDSRTRRNNLSGGLAVRRTAGPSDRTNSPHPSSREGHHSTVGVELSSSFLLSDLNLHGFHAAAAAACSRVQWNSVPSTHMRCIITASRRASATIAFFIPRRLYPAASWIMEEAMRLQLRCHGDIDLSQPGMQCSLRPKTRRTASCQGGG